ncbi:hypothetical protein [Vibrio phage vB_VmeM-Yong XC32]|nr:hypothetical protein [Vibrio phage vB_VmeM-Yong XC31]QAX96543.1 hypothetical protein [Vibrio phage vB_VmeM-Yong XC32]QAX96861.1 hypothetical protein [Vibrio phage vB_VmeM-Yong MS31]QAX97166.1 hypothetical protein [Vibrio phage vB_VmeM-Yong MS32]
MLSKKQPYCQTSTVNLSDKLTYVDEATRNILRHDVTAKQIIHAAKDKVSESSTVLFEIDRKVLSLPYVATHLEIAMQNLLQNKNLWPLKFKFRAHVKEGKSVLYMSHNIHDRGFGHVVASLQDELIMAFSKLWDTPFIETPYDNLVPTKHGVILYDSTETSLALNVTEEQLCNIVVYVKEDGKEHICLRANSDLSNLYVL